MKNRLHFLFKFDIIQKQSKIASVAQQVEQLIRNQQVAGPNPATSSKKTAIPRVWRFFYANEQFVTVGTCRLFLRGPRKTFVLWGEQKVAGPNPANSIKKILCLVHGIFFELTSSL